MQSTERGQRRAYRILSKSGICKSITRRLWPRIGLRRQRVAVAAFNSGTRCQRRRQCRNQPARHRYHEAARRNRPQRALWPNLNLMCPKCFFPNASKLFTQTGHNPTLPSSPIQGSRFTLDKVTTGHAVLCSSSRCLFGPICLFVTTEIHCLGLLAAWAIIHAKPRSDGLAALQHDRAISMPILTRARAWIGGILHPLPARISLLSDLMAMQSYFSLLATAVAPPRSRTGNKGISWDGCEAGQCVPPTDAARAGRPGYISVCQLLSGTTSVVVPGCLVQRA